MLLHFRRNILVLRRRVAGALLLDKPLASPQRTIAIQHLFVYPDRQRQGIGSLLLRDAERVTQTLFPSILRINATVPLNLGVFFEKNGYELDALLGDSLIATKLLNAGPSPINDGKFVQIDIPAGSDKEPHHSGENTESMASDANKPSHGALQCVDCVRREEQRSMAEYCGACGTWKIARNAHLPELTPRAD